MNSRILLSVVAGLLSLGLTHSSAQEEPFYRKKNGDNYRSRLMVSCSPNTSHRINKPVLYPVIGPHGVA
ncbi:MAG: hypothetical protein CM1200mP29_03590 [Verrucomicrobiota bacterium]|nr:MAG: hypothetical protein CM1200mP29_03590 [Verrucomicrobiota bacterium]